MKLFFKILFVTFMVASNPALSEDTIGNDSEYSKITGGTSVPSNRYLYYAKVLVRELKEGSVFTCGGALIHQDVVLTAAQCYRDNAVTTVMINGEEVNVKDARLHSDWSQNFPFDIMVLKLERIFQFDPVIYHTFSMDISIEEGRKVFAIGYDAATSSTSASSNLNELELFVSSFAQCNKNYAYLLNEDKHICTTSTPEGMNNSCMLDGGGPLIIKGVDGAADTLVGIASFGKECSALGTLNGFTLISGYEEWILENICAVSEVRLSNCPMPSASPSNSPFPSQVPSKMPSISYEPTSPSASPSTVPTITRLDCSDYPCGNEKNEKWNVCTVNPATRMTEQGCSRKGEKYFLGVEDHYCGDCRNSCFELDEYPDPNDKCDDVKFCKFELTDGSMERCAWLQKQDRTTRVLYCAEGQDARSLCRETCGICSDACKDDNSGRVIVNGVKRTCDYLRNRPVSKDTVCFDGSDAWDKCKEYCGNCNIEI